ncbi:hypothetical protein [Streptomyces sp. PTY087I2]|uniref:hypothetical protein n=1 Tax=Streptomyces sp. PTY087I2 TaxID=1819298 RepID=UPI00080B492C|nr:hypothetical protein [Streptomyces sp. PTY087I2]OCC09031.1 hypothetical protein A3Q37_05052 [Streptomyces sp. PTY087I2]
MASVADAHAPADAVSPPVPRWAESAAKAVPWCVLPSGLWRVAVIIGMAFGWLEGGTSVAEEVYMLALTVVSELLALLTLGLVRPWGEILPRRLPRVGGRRVPMAAAVVPAALGALAVTAVCLYFLLNTFVFHFQPEPLIGTGDKDPSGVMSTGWVLALSYGPLLAWGPLLGAVTYAYYRRRCRTPMSSSGAA